MNRHKKSKSFKNPTESPFEKFNRRLSEPPFIRAIERSNDCRIYRFANSINEQFQIIVEFPLPEYGGVTVEIAGEKINPDQLRNAIAFVESNEMRFCEAFENSSDFLPNPKQTEISEINFQMLAKTDTDRQEKK